MSLYQVIYLISFVVAIFVNREGKVPQLFLVYLGSICLFELVLANLEIYLMGTNLMTYNVYGSVSICILIRLFNRGGRNTILTVFLVSWIIVMIYSIMLTGLNERIWPSYVMGMTYVVFLIIRRFQFELSGEEYKNVFEDYLTWIGFGTMTLFVCSFPILVFINPMIVENGDPEMAYFKLLDIGNVVMSIGFLLAVITLWKKN